MFTYTEPSLLTILAVSGLLVLLNIVSFVINRLCYAGLVAQIILGALWGSPLGGFLDSTTTETAMQQLGYVGLLLLVAEGGVDMRLDVLASRQNFALALLVGVTGVIVPIGFSLVLLPLAFGYSLLQSFACGAALSSTSMGTILTLLSSVGELDSTHSSSSGLLHTRMGVILIGAALFDDIVGLVMSRIVQVLGKSDGLQPWTVARPIVSSFLLVAVTAAASRCLLRPLARFLHRRTSSLPLHGHLAMIPVLPITYSTYAGLLLAFVTLAHCIDSSPLIGVFCAGAMAQYTFKHTQLDGGGAYTQTHSVHHLSPRAALNRLANVQRDLLLPLFFASIGFAIPLRQMFVGALVWKGFIYAGMMALGKAIAGSWLGVAEIVETHASRRALARDRRIHATHEGVEMQTVPESVRMQTAAAARTSKSMAAPLLLGLSLVARGEIGFLIIALAQEAGLVGSASSSKTGREAYIVTVWALVLNTLAGPMLAGILVKAKDGKWATSIARGRWGVEEEKQPMNVTGTAAVNEPLPRATLHSPD